MVVDDMPKFLASDPTDNTHALTIKEPDWPAQTVILQLALRGVTLLLNVRGVTLDEWTSDAFKREKNRPWARGLRVMRLKTIGRGWGGHPWWAQPLFVMIK